MKINLQLNTGNCFLGKSFGKELKEDDTIYTSEFDYDSLFLIVIFIILISMLIFL